MNRTQLKKLIKEVIREVEGMDVDTPETSTSSEPLPNKTKFDTEKKQTVIKLKVAGLRDASIKKILGKLTSLALKNDLEVIKAECERNGSRVAGLDASEIESKEREAGKGDVGKKDPSKMSPEERLAMIEPGEKEGEWKAATEKDMKDAKEKARLKKAKIAAGTYDPTDTTLWSDEDWDNWEKQNPQLQKRKTAIGTLRH